MPQRKASNLVGWWNKPTFHQLGANLVPLQNFVKRKEVVVKNPFHVGAQYISDDQTVDTTTLWEDTWRIKHEERQSHPKLKQTVVFVGRGPPVATIAPPPEQVLAAEQVVLEKRQRKSQQKNKVLMLLQLEQVLAQRSSLRQRRQILMQGYFVEVLRRRIKHRRTILFRKLEALDRRIKTKRQQQQPEKQLLDLEGYYRKFDSCLEELHDRNDIMELEGFKQLVIREVEERAEALQIFQERLKVVHGQLMQKFIVDELIEGGLYSGPRRPKETLNEWIHISEDFSDQRNAISNSPEEGSEWVVCEF